MSKSKWNSKGAIAPLFDRLKDEDHFSKEETPPFINLDEDSLKASIQKELSHLFSTRCPSSLEEYDDLMPKDKSFAVPKLYGLPDFPHFDPENSIGKEKLKDWLRNLIKLYEPRLESPIVEILSFNTEQQSLTVSIGGNMILGNVRIPISFPLNMSNFQSHTTKN